jgi:hypothetical protein
MAPKGRHCGRILNQERWNDTPPEAVAEPPKKGELRVRASTPAEMLEAKDRAEFLRLSKLPENLRKSEEEIWEMVQSKESVGN